MKWEQRVFFPLESLKWAVLSRTVIKACQKSWLLPRGCLQAFQRPPQNFPGLLCSCVSSLALVYIKSVAWSGQCFPVLYIHSNSVSVLFREILPMHFLLLYWEHSQEKYLDPCWQRCSQDSTVSRLLPFLPAPVQTVWTTWIEKHQILSNVKNQK